jgi:hypothetical protein
VLILKVSDVTARKTLGELVRVGVMRKPENPVLVAFPLAYRDRLFPNLFVGPAV